MSVYNRASASCTGPFPRRARGFSVRVLLDKSKGKGIGVFAGEEIPMNTKIAKITEESRYFNEEEAVAYLDSLPSEEERVYWLTHVYAVKDKIAEDPHDLLMINHFSSPNIATVINDYGDGYIYAIRKIKDGEELLEDYNTYADLPFLERLMKKHSVTENYLEQ